MEGLSFALLLTEAFACSIFDKFKMSRKTAISLICGIGLVGSVVFCTNAGLYILDIVDHFYNNYALIIGGGILFSTRLISFVLSHFKWDPVQLKERHHEPEEDDLLV